MQLMRRATMESLLPAQALLEALAAREDGLRMYAESGIGEHVRHLIDHFLAFRAGLEQGRVDYDRRNRESLVSGDLTLAKAAVQELLTWLEDAPELHRDQALEILSEVSCREPVRASIASNVKRELHYLIYHSIHHLAYCALLARQAGLELDPAIGLAPGTAMELKAANA